MGDYKTCERWCALNPGLSSFSLYLVPNSVTLVVIAITDLSITAALLWRLYKTRTYSRSQATQQYVYFLSF